MHRKCFGTTQDFEDSTPYKVANYSSVFTPKEQKEQAQQQQVQAEKVVPEVRKEIPHRIPDANVVKLGLGNLGRAVDEVMTGDPTYCSGNERFPLPRTQRTRSRLTPTHTHTHTLQDARPS